jgi:hypothetical protein
MLIESESLFFSTVTVLTSWSDFDIAIEIGLYSFTLPEILTRTFSSNKTSLTALLIISYIGSSLIITEESTEIEVAPVDVIEKSGTVPTDSGVGKGRTEKKLSFSSRSFASFSAFFANFSRSSFCFFAI